MVNVIVPITKNAKDYFKILDRLTNISSVNLIVGCRESEFKDIQTRYLEAENLSLHCYDDSSHKEEIINSLQSYILSGPLMVLRKPITMEEFNKFITSKNNIVTCAKNNNKIKSFMLMIWQKILKLILGVKLYEGDSSVILFSEELSMVLSTSRNLSYSSRVDRWKGIDQGTVAVGGERIKTSPSKKQNIYCSIVIAVSIVVATIVTVFVCLFAQMSIIIGLLLACLDIIALAVACIMGVMIAFNNTVGKKKFDRAMEIDFDESEEEIEE